MSDTTSGATGIAMVNARTEKELREKLEALLGELKGFKLASIRATVMVNKDNATNEDKDLIIQVLDKWQEQEKTHSPEIACSKTGHK